MLGVRYEEYSRNEDGSPCVIHRSIEKTALNSGGEMNWHENLEIQAAQSGEGTVFADGKEYTLNKDCIVVVNSDVLHYTYTKNRLCYTAVIINSDFLRNSGLNPESLQFPPVISDPRLVKEINLLGEIYEGEDPLKAPKLNQKLLEILILMTENHSLSKAPPHAKGESLKRVKETIKYIRHNFSRKITLNGIAANVYTDKYVLSREFKRATGKTVVEYLNAYRCARAEGMILKGATVTEAAFACGFNNLSFFSKTFKKYTGRLPSQIK